MARKRCTKCGKAKPLAEFAWKAGDHGNVYRESRCPACLRAYQATYRRTLRGRLMGRLHSIRSRLRHAPTVARHQALERLAAQYVAEIARHPRSPRP